MQIQPCTRCGRPLRQPQGINTTGDKSVAVFISALTVGCRPRLKSRAERRVFCMPCTASIAMGPVPENGAFNLAVYETLCDLAHRDMTILQAAWEQKTMPRLALRPMPGSIADRTLEAGAPLEPTYAEAV